MYHRDLTPPKRSFFLFGPRGSGKTTWLRMTFSNAKWFDLLRVNEFLRLSRNIELFRQEIEILPKGHWIVVDEIQKMPSILDEVQAIITDHGSRYHFALSGSSARKLKRLGTNLLAGRVINRQFFPLTCNELEYKVQVDELMRFGSLPAVRATPKDSIDILEAYVANYIREEIQQEALVKDLDSFARFLEVAALMNGQVTNVAGIARDAGVARPTVQRYFDILVDTLIAVWIPAWRPRAKVKEVSLPKFYFFDPGVVRGLAGRLRDPLDSQETGPLLETLVCHELRAYIQLGDTGGKLSYWGTPSESEIDFVWTRNKESVGIEVKAASEWRSEYGKTLKNLIAGKVLGSAWAVYRGTKSLKDGPVRVLPFAEFIKELNAGKIIKH